ncbi:hypothetical protein PUW24_14675 [Paenibacillus urinalis]|uniref:Uncharacterized protein n=1 Tax=Paenibacillus urinalis TaxID=521520 RepID=A0AAX3N4G1_9BACL|nr:MULTISPECIES: hypothetical protein [Paenibacillus]WDH84009.1 hypothetical protein PUW23_07280 [Paenibacillus urinalis]WDH95462.1 hypothetical protein PUW24_14675 [Paenibacillus urinalis]WDI03659.1 hypothetical protein PUW25_06800 [Paenibacillus urinalis]GAK39014.1 hypothetical protein TCA2_0740 [Paenibacillus sp. TCA20]
MQLEFANLPPTYYANLPNPGGHFPFTFNQEHAPYIMDFLGTNSVFLDDSSAPFMLEWMNNLDSYPICFCLNTSVLWKEDLAQLCTLHSLEHELLNRRITLLYIRNKSQLASSLPLFLNMASCNEQVIWSIGSNESPFAIEPISVTYQGGIQIQDTVVIDMTIARTIFWPGYDGNCISVLSNDPYFSNISKIRSSFPAGVELIEIELSS